MNTVPKWLPRFVAASFAVSVLGLRVRPLARWVLPLFAPAFVVGGAWLLFAERASRRGVDRPPAAAARLAGFRPHGDLLVVGNVAGTRAPLRLALPDGADVHVDLIDDGGLECSLRLWWRRDAGPVQPATLAIPVESGALLVVDSAAWGQSDVRAEIVATVTREEQLAEEHSLEAPAHALIRRGHRVVGVAVLAPWVCGSLTGSLAAADGGETLTIPLSVPEPGEARVIHEDPRA